MLAPSPMTIVQMSARSTAPYQMLAPFSTVTSPIRVAVGATKASGWTVGRLPSNSNSGMGTFHTTSGSAIRRARGLGPGTVSGAGVPGGRASRGRHRALATRHTRALLCLGLPAVEPPAGGRGARPGPDRQCAGVQLHATAVGRPAAGRRPDGRAADASRTSTPGQLPDDLDWTEDPFTNSNWVFQLPLAALGRPAATGRRWHRQPGDAERYEAIVHDWYEDNPSSEPPSRLSWYDMAVGFRAIALVCLAATFTDESRPGSTTRSTRTWRCCPTPAQYASPATTALYQNLGLLALGCSLRRRRWRDLAVERARPCWTSPSTRRG